MAQYTSQGVVLMADSGSGLTAIANLTDISGFGITRNPLDATDLSSAFEKVVPGLVRGNTVTFTVRYDPTNSEHADFWTNVTGNDPADTDFRLDLNDASPSEYFDFSGPILSVEFGGLSPDNMITNIIQVKINTAVTKTT